MPFDGASRVFRYGITLMMCYERFANTVHRNNPADRIH
jgi:hypothetical protein